MKKEDGVISAVSLGISHKLFQVAQKTIKLELAKTNRKDLRSASTDRISK